MSARGGSGIWELFVPGVAPGARYKYHVVSRYRGYRADKADPFAFFAETPPRRASMVWDLEYQWWDADWLLARQERQSLAAPVAVYEVHLGSWMRVPEEGRRQLTYREIAPLLAGHVKRLGFTHVELLPVMEHPYYGSWGYQTTGYFAATSRYGTPQDLMFLIDHLHQEGIGVILDWVPSHFPGDEHGLAFFDGTHLYEHADPRKGYHPDWSSWIFTGLPRGARFRLQVGHGLDARRPGLPGSRSHPPPLPSQPDHLPVAVRLQREFRAASLP
jgi:1,4-alpha-glucan branching enzyme